MASRIRLGPAITTLLSVPAMCLGDAGALDPAFGSGGLVVSSFPHDSNEETLVADVAIQAGVGIVVVGRTNSPVFDNQWLVALYNDAGSLDPTFGDGGIVATDFGSYGGATSNDLAYAVAIQGSGQSAKIVVAGWSWGRGLALARYNTDGSLDPSFGMDGVVFTSSFDGYWLTPVSGRDIAVDTFGNIVVPVTVRNTAGHRDLGIARYDANGDLDLSFDGDGLAIIDFGQAYEDAYAIAVDPVGDTVVVAGQTVSGTPGGSNLALARFNFDGSLDLSFNDTGTVVTDLLPAESAIDIELQEGAQGDTKIVLLGTAGTTQDPLTILIRYNEDGSIDPGFSGVVGLWMYGGPTGLAIADLDGNGVGDPDGKIAICSGAFLVRGFASNGDVDPEFGPTGKIAVSFDGQDGAGSIAIQDNGMIVVAGTTRSFGYDETGEDIALARITSEGSLDTSFGDGSSPGKVTTDVLGPTQDILYDLVLVQPDGSIMTAGRAWGGAAENIALARYDPNGAPDHDFGTDGMVMTDFSMVASEYDIVSRATAHGMALQADGKLVVALSTNQQFSAVPEIILARYNPDGTLDDTFDVDGLVSMHDAAAYAVAIQPDGRILVAGAVYAGSTNRVDFMLAQYLSNGALDGSFGDNGLVVTGTPADDEAWDVLIQPDGKILIAGYSSGSPTTYSILRYNADGTPDTDFGVDGLVTATAPPMPGPSRRPPGLAIQIDGSIILAGPGVSMVSRYDDQGNLDPSFGNQGRATTPMYFYSQGAHAMVVQPDDKILVAGSRYVDSNALEDFGLVRLTAAGDLDTTFGTDGLVLTDFGSSRDLGTAIALQPGGKIVVGGQTSVDYANNGWDFALARYENDLDDPPIGCAGPDQAIHCGLPVFLDGSCSYDDNTENLDFSWSVVSFPGSAAPTIFSPDTCCPWFVPLEPGPYVLELVVTDSIGQISEPDQVVVSSENVAPTADAGPDRVVGVGTDVELDGSGSWDPDPTDELSYAWTMVSAPPGSVVTLEDPGTSPPYFTPDVLGDYTIQLVVDDGCQGMSTDEVTITASSEGGCVESYVLEVIGIVDILPPGSFTNGGNQTAFNQILVTIARMAQRGNLSGALNALDQAIVRVDGCAENESPDGPGSGRDWVVDCSAQLEIHTLLTEAKVYCLAP